MTEKGILSHFKLPHKGFADCWDKIFVAPGVKTRLLSQALLEFTVRGKVSPVAVPLHGIILLVGPPGTGKTSLSRGLANRVAETLKGPALHYLEVEPHALASSGLGRSQQATRDLLQKTVAEHASQGPLIVLLDEVETMAPDRRKLSWEANPVDVHRATDAVLASIDHLAGAHHHLLFLATSNYGEAIDDALMSRADLVQFIGKPDKDGCKAILEDTLGELGKKWPEVSKLFESTAFSELVDACLGLDAREIRKAVLGGCTFSKEKAVNPNLLTMDDLLQSVGIKHTRGKLG